MEATTNNRGGSLQALEPLVGDWKMAASFDGMPAETPLPRSASNGCRAGGS